MATIWVKTLNFKGKHFGYLIILFYCLPCTEKHRPENCTHLPGQFSENNKELEEGKFEMDEGEYEAEECKYEVGEGGIWLIFTFVDFQKSGKEPVGVTLPNLSNPYVHLTHMIEHQINVADAQLRGLNL